MSAKTVHIEFYSINAALGRLVINGHSMQIPDSSEIEARWSQEIGKTIVSLPLAYLVEGSNTIRFEAGRGNWTPTNIFDNYEFGDAVLIFSQR